MTVDFFALQEAETGKPGTNWKQVSPENRRRVNPLVRHYMKQAHPFRACVRDNRKRFGPNAEKVCAVVKDMGEHRTTWRKGGGKVREFVEEWAEHYTARLIEAAGGDVEGLEGMILAEALRVSEDAPAEMTIEELEVEEREFAMQKRRRMAAEGHALPDGSFPIATKKDLKNAQRAIGRTAPGKRARVRRHIRKRAKALGVSEEEVAAGWDLVEEWSPASRAAALLAKKRKHPDWNWGGASDDELATIERTSQVFGNADQRAARMERERRRRVARHGGTGRVPEPPAFGRAPKKEPTAAQRAEIDRLHSFQRRHDSSAPAGRSNQGMLPANVRDRERRFGGSIPDPKPGETQAAYIARLNLKDAQKIAAARAHYRAVRG